MASRGQPWLWFAVAMLMMAPMPASAQQIDTLKEIFEQLRSCWKPPPPSKAVAVDVTVIVSFNREGAILGRPRITFETEGAGDNDRLAYRIAVMETLQRCTPLPFSEGLGGAIAGRPLAVRFWTRKSPPKPAERRAWLTPKIL
jgi:hypothetical protein